MHDSSYIVRAVNSAHKQGNAAYNCVIILGPTATGKTALGVQVAQTLSAEIVSADSRQVYRGLDIGSGKDLSEYTVPYHLIDIVDVSTEYSVFEYQNDFHALFPRLLDRGVFPVIVGGTGMYLDCVIRDYDLQRVPTNISLREKLNGLSMEELTAYLFSLKGELHNHTDLTERHRLLRAIEIAEFQKNGAESQTVTVNLTKVKVKPLIYGITFERSELRKRITQRLRQRMKVGLIEEIAELHNAGIAWERLERLGLEYRFVAEFLQGKIASQDDLFTKLNIAIGQFAKRQETWFRGMQRKGIAIEWLQ